MDDDTTGSDVGDVTHQSGGLLPIRVKLTELREGTTCFCPPG